MGFFILGGIVFVLTAEYIRQDAMKDGVSPSKAFWAGALFAGIGFGLSSLVYALIY